MSSLDRARWRAWGRVADIMGLGPVAFEPDVDEDGWVAIAGDHTGRGKTGADALASLCRAAALGR